MEALRGSIADHVLIIHDQHRVGEISVLKQLGNRLPLSVCPYNPFFSV